MSCVFRGKAVAGLGNTHLCLHLDLPSGVDSLQQAYLLLPLPLRTRRKQTVTHHTCHCVTRPPPPHTICTQHHSQTNQPTGTLTNKAVNGIHWSPNGHNIVLSGLKALNGQLEFFNVDEFEILAAAEHFMATNVEWDPTGGCLGIGSLNEWDGGGLCVCFRFGLTTGKGRR